MATTTKTNGWPGTRAGLIESIATAQALAWTANTDREYMHWDNRRAELEAKAGTLTEEETNTVVRICGEKRMAYGG
jgi:hypothetical protein